MNEDKRVKRLAVLAILTALVACFTMFLKVPTAIGYANLGDGVILFGSLLLGSVSAVAAAVGSALADLLQGYAVYAPWTLIIKGGMALICGVLLRKQQDWLHQIIAYVVSELWMVAGYFLVEAFILSYGVSGAVGSIVPNLLQGAAGVCFALMVAPARRSIEKGIR